MPRDTAAYLHTGPSLFLAMPQTAFLDRSHVEWVPARHNLARQNSAIANMQ